MKKLLLLGLGLSSMLCIKANLCQDNKGHICNLKGRWYCAKGMTKVNDSETITEIGFCKCIKGFGCYPRQATLLSNYFGNLTGGSNGNPKIIGSGYSKYRCDYRSGNSYFLGIQVKSCDDCPKEIVGLNLSCIPNPAYIPLDDRY